MSLYYFFLSLGHTLISPKRMIEVHDKHFCFYCFCWPRLIYNYTWFWLAIFFQLACITKPPPYRNHFGLMYVWGLNPESCDCNDWKPVWWQAASSSGLEDVVMIAVSLKLQCWITVTRGCWQAVHMEVEDESGKKSILKHSSLNTTME
jgi:hypothetical protein